ncbi:Uncharacterised protein [Bordetella pertussis]|nr:Uncharacterised protein [Bordetella pertussis]CPJ54747.1 Uncharacterised protein [Bordetella pertussis]CPN62432.1 Uncharacterised protein [Bordetella pertussis]CPO44871.1 Uncharacterised protein [Bordetella pertussis]
MRSNCAMSPGVATHIRTMVRARKERRRRPGGNLVAVSCRMTRPIQARSATTAAMPTSSTPQIQAGVCTAASASSSRSAARRVRSRGISARHSVQKSLETTESRRSPSRTWN